jgi:hypothetical protein
MIVSANSAALFGRFIDVFLLFLEEPSIRLVVKTPQTRFARCSAHNNIRVNAESVRPAFSYPHLVCGRIR